MTPAAGWGGSSGDLAAEPAARQADRRSASCHLFTLYVKGRIIDLSLVAAQRIEMTRAGVVPVRLEVLRKIEVVDQPNRKLPAAQNSEAERRVADAPPAPAKRPANLWSQLFGPRK